MIFLKRLSAVFAGILIIFVFLSFSVSFGAQRNIRIGLERHYIGVGSIPISDSVVTVQIGEGTKYSAAGGVTAVPVNGSYYDSGLKFNTYNEAKLYADAFSGEAVPALTDRGWGVYFPKTAESTTLAEEEPADEDNTGVTEEDTEETTQYEASNTDISGFTGITLGGNAVAFNAGGKTAYIINGNDCVHISTGSGIVALGEYKYRDVIEIYRNANTVNAVNILPVEKYLLGVVTSEMPQSWPIEAIKAQAVAARTYANRNFGKHGRYDLCDGTDCQQYNGVNGESSASVQAVNATSGIMAYYNGQLIAATYFSSSGGHTQNAEDVWGTAVPYLVGVKEINETGGKQWVRTFSFTELTKLCKDSGHDVGNVTGVRVGETLDGGLVKTMIIEGTADTVTLEREEIRELFKNSAEGSLYSRNFKLSSSAVKSNNVYVLSQSGDESADLNVISAVSAGGAIGPVKDANIVVVGKDGEYVLTSGGSNMTEAQDSITITGSGYGHGVGMSQYGAKGMAELGYSYTEILKYYYTGIDVH